MNVFINLEINHIYTVKYYIKIDENTLSKLNSARVHNLGNMEYSAGNKNRNRCPNRTTMTVNLKYYSYLSSSVSEVILLLNSMYSNFILMLEKKTSSFREIKSTFFEGKHKSLTFPQTEHVSSEIVVQYIDIF